MEFNFQLFRAYDGTIDAREMYSISKYCNYTIKIDYSLTSHAQTTV